MRKKEEAEEQDEQQRQQEEGESRGREWDLCLRGKKKKKKRFDNKRVGGGLVGEVMGLRVWEGVATVEKVGGIGAVREAVENCDDKSERMR